MGVAGITAIPDLSDTLPAGHFLPYLHFRQGKHVGIIDIEGTAIYAQCKRKLHGRPVKLGVGYDRRGDCWRVYLCNQGRIDHIQWRFNDEGETIRIAVVDHGHYFSVQYRLDRNTFDREKVPSAVM